MDSDGNTTPDVELEEANIEDESNAETQDTAETSTDGEQEKPLSLEEEVQTNSGEKYAKIQEEVWTERIAKETDLDKREELIKGLEENPSTRWLAPKVKENLGFSDSQPKSEIDLVNEVISQKEFAKNKDELYKLPTKIRNEAVREYQDLKELGADPYKALEKVLNKAKVSTEEINQTKGETRDHMQIPRPGRSPTDKSTYSMDELAKMDQSEYNRICDLEESGQVSIVAK